MVNDGDKNKSKSQFDETYQQVHDDVVNLVDINFGAKGEMLDKNRAYIYAASKSIILDILSIGTYIRIANHYLSA